MHVPSTWAPVLKRFVDYVVARGVVRDVLLKELGISDALLMNPDARLPVTLFYSAVESAMSKLKDPILGVRYISDAGFSSIDAVGFLAMTSRTVGEAMQ